INLLNEKWPTGTDLTVDVVVTQANEPATQEALGRLDAAMLAIPGVSQPVTHPAHADGTATAYSYTLGGGQNDIKNQDIVKQVREHVIPDVFGGLRDPGAQALASRGGALRARGVPAPGSGVAAYPLAVVSYYAGGMPSVFLFVLGLSFLLLLVAF